MLRVHFIKSIHIEMGQNDIMSLLNEVRPDMICFESKMHGEENDTRKMDLSKYPPAFKTDVVDAFLGSYMGDMEKCEKYSKDNGVAISYLESNHPEFNEIMFGMGESIFDGLYNMYVQNDSDGPKTVQALKSMIKLVLGVPESLVKMFMSMNCSQFDPMFSDDRNVEMANNLFGLSKGIIQRILLAETEATICVVTGAYHTNSLRDHFEKLMNGNGLRVECTVHEPFGEHEPDSTMDNLMSIIGSSVPVVSSDSPKIYPEDVKKLGSLMEEMTMKEFGELGV